MKIYRVELPGGGYIEYDKDPGVPCAKIRREYKANGRVYPDFDSAERDNAIHDINEENAPE